MNGLGRMIRSGGAPMAGLALALGILLGGGEVVAAQGEAGAEGTLRPFWHVFVAYALAWVILFGWLVSIARRLRRVEGRVEGDAADDGQG